MFHHQQKFAKIVYKLVRASEDVIVKYLCSLVELATAQWVVIFPPLS